MVDKALLDTDIFSEILKGIDQNVVTHATAYRAAFGRYTISVITVMEIVKGLHKLQREDRVQQFLAGLADVELLTQDLHSSESAGRIYADLERTGQPIGRADPIIASINCFHCFAIRLNLDYRQCRTLPTHPNAGLRFEIG